VLVERATAQQAEHQNSVCASQAVDGERRDASGGGDTHHWIEQMAEGVIEATSDIGTLRCVGVQMECMVDATLAQSNFAPAAKG
jgi:hypothetical protein